MDPTFDPLGDFQISTKARGGESAPEWQENQRGKVAILLMKLQTRIGTSSFGTWRRMKGLLVKRMEGESDYNQRVASARRN